MTVAEWIADYLYEKGVRHAFGIVGGANLTLFEAISRKIEVISVAQEQAAAIAANYYFKVSRRIAPVLVTAGGGAANAITGVIEAQMDGTPLLVLSGNELTRWFSVSKTRTVGFQGFNPCDIVHSFTKLCLRAEGPESVKIGLNALYNSALEHRQGACWLDIAQDIATKEIPNEPL